MIHSPKSLVHFWQLTHNRPGWMFFLKDRVGLDRGDWEFLSDLDDDFNQKVKRGHYKKDLEAFGVSREWVKDRRTAYLEKGISDLTKEIFKIEDEIAIMRDRDEPLFGRLMLKKPLEGLRNRRDKMRRELVNMENTCGLTEEQIERARQFPMTELIGKKRIPCPIHQGKDKNMGAKGNFAHCFVCGVTLDAIGWLMKVEHKSFVEAVKELS